MALNKMNKTKKYNNQKSDLHQSMVLKLQTTLRGWHTLRRDSMSQLNIKIMLSRCLNFKV